MKNPIRILTALLVFALLLPLAFAQTQQSLGALERGYRTGYSDGYQAGYSDSTQAAARDYKSKDEYQRADRAYVAAYGTLEDYRDGYQQGLEAGYNSGYEHRNFDSTIPTNLSRRSTDDAQTSATVSSTSSGNTGVSSSNSSSGDNSYGSIWENINTSSNSNLTHSPSYDISVENLIIHRERVTLLKRKNHDGCRFAECLIYTKHSNYYKRLLQFEGPEFVPRFPTFPCILVCYMCSRTFFYSRVFIKVGYTAANSLLNILFNFL